MDDGAKHINSVATMYQLEVARVGRAHYIGAQRCERRGRLLGTTSAMLGAIVGTSIFASLGTSPSAAWKITVGLVSTIAAVLVALQTFLGYADRAAKHRGAGAAYGKLRRDFDQFFLDIGYSGDQQQALSELRRLRSRMGELGDASPLTPPSTYRSAKKKVLPGQGVLGAEIDDASPENDQGPGQSNTL